jgi:hypothetical protein
VLTFASGALADEKRWFEGSDKVFIRQREQFVRISEPHIHLTRAQRSFAKGHRSAAADELEKASAGFAYFEDRAAGEHRAQLRLASRALTKLADDVRDGDVQEITEVDRAVADAKRVLAGTPKAAPKVGPPSPAPPVEH